MPGIMTEKNNSTRRRQILRQRTYHCHKKKKPYIHCHSSISSNGFTQQNYT